MKYILLPVILWSLTILSLPAQITFTSENFPQAGDTAFYAIDNLPTKINITAPGTYQSWNFISLRAPFARPFVFRQASEGMFSELFPEADFIATWPNGGEGYYHTSSKAVEWIGYTGPDPAGLNLELITRLSSPLIERYAPLRYGDSYESETSFSTPFSVDDISGELIRRLPVVPDSLRIETHIHRHEKVDSWGTLLIPGGLYDVLRVKRVENKDSRLFIKVGSFNWQDATSLLDTPGYFSKNKSVSYRFYSDEVKEPIAVVTMDETGENVIRVEYKANNTGLFVLTSSFSNPTVFAFPNPALLFTRFEFINMPPGNYMLKIYNLLGVKIWNREYFINVNLTEEINLLQFKKGTYLYSLTDESGKIISTKRLMVVRP